MQRSLVTMLLLIAGPALAQSHPPLVPNRDVTVTYETSSGRDMTITYAGGGQHMRVEGINPSGGYGLFDRAAGTLIIVEPAQHMYMRMAAPPAMRANMFDERLKNASFAREGHDTVAGIGCTEWKVTTDKGTGNACIDANGLVLRARDATSTDPQHTMLVAKHVNYHAVPASAFEPPADFKAMTLPAGMPPPGGQPKP